MTNELIYESVDPDNIRDRLILYSAYMKKQAKEKEEAKIGYNY